MILDLDNGRELRLPDEMPDETARQLKALILTLEERARTAEAQSVALGQEVAHLRAEVQALAARPLPAPQVLRDSSDVIAALKAVEAAVRADRMMVPDEYGEYTRSRVA